MAKISRDRADELVAQLVEMHEPGGRRTALIGLIMVALRKSFASKKLFTRAANGIILKHDLDVEDHYPLFRA